MTSTPPLRAPRAVVPVAHLVLVRSKAVRHAVFFVFVLTLCRVSSAQPYFPIQSDKKSEGVSEFESKWYSSHLSAMKEPSLFAQQNGREEYRFLWLRTFHKPIAIRVWVDADAAQMRIIRLSGAGGYEPGKIESDKTLKLSFADWKRFRDCVAKAQFWQMPTKDLHEELGLDGSQWILEGRVDGKYHIVDHWTPSGGAYYDCCRLLITLSKEQIPHDEFY